MILSSYTVISHPNPALPVASWHAAPIACAAPSIRPGTVRISCSAVVVRCRRSKILFSLRLHFGRLSKAGGRHASPPIPFHMLRTHTRLYARNLIRLILILRWRTITNSILGMSYIRLFVGKEGRDGALSSSMLLHSFFTGLFERRGVFFFESKHASKL
ncbi:hypothetical protein DL95DRAFT_384041 [Leptodontidium sp. 2 PMI_412]|nr:hypothetical protein DL95DRAFT_384041 [Leptodontidium sp. 2 PMI_412]